MHIHITKFTPESRLTDFRAFRHSIFQHPQWLEAVSHTRLKPLYLNFRNDNGEVIARFSGLIETTPRFRRQHLYGYSAPAFKVNDPGVWEACYRALQQYGRRHKFSRIILGSYDQQAPLEVSAGGFYPFQRTEYVIPLQTGDPTDRFHHQIKRHLTKATKSHPEFKRETATALPRLQEMLKEVRHRREKKQGKDYDPYYLRHLSPGLLTQLMEQGIARLYSLCLPDGIHALECNLEIKGKVYMLLKATSAKGYKNGFSSLLSHLLMEQYRESGFDYYNLGGRPPGRDGDGLALYKKRLGATEKPLQGSTTNFISWPLRGMNPLLNLSRQLPRNPVMEKLKERLF